MKSIYTILTLLLISIILVIGCKKKKNKLGANDSTIEEKVQENFTNSIDIVTRSMEFQTLDSIPSGWNTFKYKNLSNETHFFLMDKYPEGKNVTHTIEEVAPVFEKGMQLINEGKREEGFAAFGKLPKWFGDIVFSGGSGLIGPKKTAITTIHLEPGYYIMECYVKMPNGMFHTSLGMAKPIAAISHLNLPLTLLSPMRTALNMIK